MLPVCFPKGIKMKFTDKAIAGFRSDRADQIVFDDDFPGFGLRCRDGKKSWVFQYSIGSGSARTSRMKLGAYPALPLREARSLAQKLHAKVVDGQHPAADRKINRAESADTFGKLVDAYLKFQKTELRPSSYAEATRYLESYAKPLHALPLAAVDNRRITKLLAEIAEEIAARNGKGKGTVTSNRLRTSIMGCFSWAMKTGLHDHNPVIGTAARKEQTRDRVLTDAEIKALWNHLADDDYGAIVKLLLLTGQRASEISDLEWSEIDLDRGLISLPGARTKNGRPHEIPMSAPVRGILESRSRSPDRKLVFGSGAGGFSGWGKCQERVNQAIAARGQPLPHWVIHDLRRTTATGMANLGEMPHVIEAVLNHVSGQRAGVAGIYNRALYKTEKAQALAKWATHVLALVKGQKSNVRTLRRA
jgi:integrase